MKKLKRGIVMLTKLTKITKLTVLTVLTVIVTVLSGCSEAEEKPSASSSDLADIYSSLDVLKADSEFVAEITLTGAFKALPEYEGANFSLTEVKVQEVIKGDERYNGQVISLIGFAPLITTEKSDRFVLFLHRYEGPVLSEEAFVVSGVFQGKFRIDDKDKIHYDNHDYLETAAFYKELDGMSLGSFKSLIKE
ncbi:outer membrane murein-binding lipoprotein Lpp [Paenibacillus endophyticus]|uniref:Outer membrane murein-binding lipoprotein Lpp n=1 Tax=Paenibacillus endophyticus TaxID=1294268 RepID=A0A7W5GCA9_9BACL|nr:hypothetical protein [Paenibacillus endophyticus]MBB3155184.1 outer membrane murein-binding lipoprotein Lpp [Paenibacillus endophyticus]